jgi:hypothetical protein
MKKIETMKFKNTSDRTAILTALGLDDVAPGEVVDVPLYLCAAGRGDGGARKPSSIECVAPQMQPADPEEHREWTKIPPPPAPVSRIVSINNNKMATEPAGVKALREGLAAKKAAESAPAIVAASPAEDKAPQAPKVGAQ